MAQPFSPVVPTGIPVRSGDYLSIGVWSGLTTAIQIRGSFILVRPDGSSTIVELPGVLSNTTRAQKGDNANTRISNDGVLVGGAVYPESPGFPSGAQDPIFPGQLYVLVQLVNTGDTQQYTQLIADYLYEGHSPVMGVYRSMFDGPGVIRTITGTQPAAGAEVSEAVPANARWKLRSFSVVIVTSSGVANRNVSLVVDDGTATNRYQMYTEATPTNITASLTRTLQWQTGYDSSTAAFQSLTDTQTVLYKACLPNDFPLGKVSKIRTKTANIAAGDQYSAPIYEVEEWLAGP